MPKTIVQDPNSTQLIYALQTGACPLCDGFRGVDVLDHRLTQKLRAAGGQYSAATIKICRTCYRREYPEQNTPPAIPTGLTTIYGGQYESLTSNPKAPASIARKWKGLSADMIEEKEL